MYSTIQHKDAPAYSAQTSRDSNIRPPRNEAQLNWCASERSQLSICKSAFVKSRRQRYCGNCWAQAVTAILEFSAARYSNLISRRNWHLSVEDVSTRFQSPSRHICEGQTTTIALNSALALGVFMIDSDPLYHSNDAYSKADKENIYSRSSQKLISIFGRKMRFQNYKVINAYPKIQTEYANAKRMFFRGFCTYTLIPLVIEKKTRHVTDVLVHDIMNKISQYGPAMYDANIL